MQFSKSFLDQKLRHQEQLFQPQKNKDVFESETDLDYVLRLPSYCFIKSAIVVISSHAS